MHVYFSDHYTVPLPEDHRFPTSKYRMLRNFLLDQEIITEAQMYERSLILNIALKFILLRSLNSIHCKKF